MIPSSSTFNTFMTFLFCHITSTICDGYHLVMLYMEFPTLTNYLMIHYHHIGKKPQFSKFIFLTNFYPRMNGRWWSSRFCIYSWITNICDHESWWQIKMARSKVRIFCVLRFHQCYYLLRYLQQYLSTSTEMHVLLANTSYLLYSLQEKTYSSFIYSITLSSSVKHIELDTFDSLSFSLIQGNINRYR